LAGKSVAKEQMAEKKKNKKQRRQHRNNRQAAAAEAKRAQVQKKRAKKARRARRNKKEAAAAEAQRAALQRKRAKNKRRKKAQAKSEAAEAAAASAVATDESPKAKKKKPRPIEKPADAKPTPPAEPLPMQRLSSQDDDITTFESADAIDLQVFSQGRFVVDCDGVPFHAFLQRSQEKRLFVLLDGAVSRKPDLAIFERRGWAALMPGNILCISDPTVHLFDKLAVGWYVGTHERDYTALMARLVDRVASQLGLTRSDIVFYASSSGGFAALMCARRLPGSNCIVVNPQIDIAKYAGKAHRKQFALAFAGERKFKDVAGMHSKRLSVLEAFPNAASLPPMVYVQNKKDAAHFQHHYEVFCETYAAPREGGVGAGGRVLTLVFEHGEGHGLEPRPLVRPLIAEALAFFAQIAHSPK
jgi:hypothetical protein